MSGVPWTEADDSFLRGFAEDLTPEELATRLARTVKSVRHRCAELSIKPRDGRSARGFRLEPGQEFSRLTVLEIALHEGVRQVRVRCTGGAESLHAPVEKWVRVYSLTSGAVKSCGCLNREVASARMKARVAPRGQDHPRYRHGLALAGSHHPNYSRWVGLMARCYRESDPGYAIYGGRGVEVASQWHDPETFVRELDALIGPCPPGMSLDRIDVDGNYEPGNVRWATPAEQAANRQLSHKERDEASARGVQVLRQRFPGKSQTWYAVFLERSVLAAAGVPEEELPALPY